MERCKICGAIILNERMKKAHELPHGKREPKGKKEKGN